MAAGTPTANPIPKRIRTSFITIHTTEPRLAPNAIRSPISFVRRATKKGHHAIKADRRENGRQRAEARGEHRNQPLRQQCLVEP
jgi:hypothetical protein